MNRRFAVTAGVTAGVVAAYAAWSVVRSDHETVATTVDDYAQFGAALLAVILAARAAWRSAGRLRLGWSLLALASVSWAAGELAWAINEVEHGGPAFRSIADAGYLDAIPLVAASVLAFPFGPSTARGRLRAVLDGLIVATSLVFVAWAIGLGGVQAQTQVGLAGALLLVAYPAGDILVLTLLAMSLRRAGGLLPVVVVLMAAFASNLVVDLAFAYANLHGAYSGFGSTLDAGWIGGYVGVALAATWPVRSLRLDRQRDEVELWQLAIPWIAVFGVIGASIFVGATGRQTGVIATWLGSSMGVIFLSNQALTFYDTLRLLVRSRQAEAQLEERTTLLNEVISRAPIGVERVGYNLRILDANQEVASMLRAPQRVVIGSSVRDYLSPEELQRVMDAFKPLRDGSEDSAEADSEVRRADGSTMWMHWTVTAVRTADGKVDYFLVILEDITAKHEVEEAQRENLAELERINRLKSEFMSMVSHEFRTALTGIQGYSEVLNTDDVSPEEVRDFAGDINSEALRLNRMITEMLDLDRIESGRIQLHIEPVDLNRLVAGAVERAQMTSTRHSLVLHLDQRVHAVDADADRLTQVVSNLLSNAIKYSPDGGEVDVTTCAVDGSVEVRVRDHGQGIPPEFLKKIFGRYERYEGSGKAQVVGTGLGLAIARQIIELHGGRIWVESSVGAGSEFQFAIPLPPAR